MSVIDVVTNSSPGSGLMAEIAAWIAALPEAMAWQCFTPIRAAKERSRVLTKFPLVLVSVPLRSASVTAAISSAPSVRPVASWSDGRTIGLRATAGADIQLSWFSDRGETGGVHTPRAAATDCRLYHFFLLPGLSGRR